MYCAPEQLDPDKNLDKRTDIYSLGLLMHQMLCGSSPYSANSNEELEDKVKYKKTKRMIDVYPAINEDFQKIVDKATQKDPNLRYQTCSEFLKDLNYNNPLSTS
jgi:serine/threonine-protein kinase